MTSKVVRRPLAAAVVVLLASSCAGSGRVPPPPSGPDGGADADGEGGAPAFPADFVSGTRLRARVWRAEGAVLGIDMEEGARGQVWYDGKLGTPCVFQGKDDALTCAPVAAFADPFLGGFPGFGFAEPGCQGSRVVVGPVGRPGQTTRDAYCAATRYARVLEQLPSIEALPQIDVFTHEVGAPLSSATLYSSPLPTSDQCTELPVASAADAHLVGRPMKPEELVAAHVERVATGHRLSQIAIVAADGTRQRIGWHDDVLDVDCTVKEGADGKWACLPASEGAFFLPNLFAEECKKFVAIPGSGDRRPNLIVTPQLAIPEQEIPLGAYYRLGEAPTKLYELAADGSCVVSATAPDGFRVVLEELPPAALDAFHAVTTGSERLRGAARVDRDGATEQVAGTITDTATGARCDLIPTADGKTRCVPEASFQRYGDAACTAPNRLASVASSDAPPPYVVSWTGDACTGGYAIFALGAAAAAPPDAYDTDAYGHGCVLNPFARGANLRYFSLGAPVDLSSFVEATLTTE